MFTGSTTGQRANTSLHQGFTKVSDLHKVDTRRQRGSARNTSMHPTVISSTKKPTHLRREDSSNAKATEDAQKQEHYLSQAQFWNHETRLRAPKTLPWQGHGRGKRGTTCTAGTRPPEVGVLPKSSMCFLSFHYHSEYYTDENDSQTKSTHRRGKKKEVSYVASVFSCLHSHHITQRNVAWPTSFSTEERPVQW